MSATYSKVTQGLYTGPTGKQIRALPNRALVRELLVYFIVSPLRHNFGMYQIGLEDIASHTGQTAEETEDALLALAHLDVLSYDKAAGWVWVREMARIQYDAPLKPSDFKCRTARKWYRGLAPSCPYLAQWWDRYVADFHLDDEGGQKRYGRNEQQPELLPAAPTEEDFALVPQGDVLPRGEAAIATIIGRHSARYAETFPPRKYNVVKGRDGNLLKVLIGQHGAEAVDAADEQLFARRHESIIARSDFSIGALQYHFNRLQRPPERPLSPATHQNVDAVHRFVERADNDEEPA